MKNNKLKEAQGMLNTPCTITEAVQIANGVVADAMQGYQNQTRSLQVAISLQIEILKSVVIGTGLITEEDFRTRYMKQVDEFNKMQAREMEKEAEDPKMGVSVSNIEVTEEK